jgi:hypothetical protein
MARVNSAYGPLNAAADDDDGARQPAAPPNLLVLDGDVIEVPVRGGAR